MRKIILFDLDGTLIESGEGIIKSLQYAFEKMNLPVKSAEELRVFIGPPLLEQFMIYSDLSQAEAEKAVSFYRERYTPIGLFESEPYEGVSNMLEELYQAGYVLGVSSSKPEKFVKQILEHFKLDHYFSAITGSSLGPERNTKALVIKETLTRLSYQVDKDNIIMVGDKEHDVLGAREEGLQCISVLYGYGTEAELKVAAPLKIVETVSELTEELLSF